jgi:CheY-like chemotaxis protein
MFTPLFPPPIPLPRARGRHTAPPRGATIALESDLATNLPPVAGLESEIREALINLIFNAVDAMPAGGTLTLRTKASHRAGDAQPDSVRLEVADTGVGMDDDTRQRCLEPFFTTKGERGTGLGLAMVYGVMRRHGADIEIHSRPGHGTTFVLIFPMMVSAASAVATTQRMVVPARLRLLVVDDDPLLLKSLREILETDGHTVISASDGQAGIDLFRAARERGESFSAVITDLGMPHIDGRRVASAIKASVPNMPVIMLTGWGQRLITEHDIPPHVDRVLSKPPKLRDLRQALAELCAADPGP